MRLYVVRKDFSNRGIKYYILEHNLIGIIWFHFRHCDGLRSLIPFLKNCRFTEKGARKLADKLNNE